MSQREPSVPLDRASLEEASLGDAAFEKELLSDFLDGSNDLLTSLDRALASRNVEDVRRAAHSLKGCCWTIGARSMGGACERLESDARDGTLDAAEPLLDRIRGHFAELESYVRRHWGL